MTGQLEAEAIAAEAIANLVETMIDAYMANFTDRNYLSLAELYRIAQNHILDNYNVKIEDLNQRYGKNALNVLSINMKDKI